MELICAICEFLTNPLIMLMLFIGCVRLGVEAIVGHRR